MNGFFHRCTYITCAMICSWKANWDTTEPGHYSLSFFIMEIVLTGKQYHIYVQPPQVHTPYTARAFSFARCITSAAPHPPPATLAANSATHGIIALWQSGSLPLIFGSDPYMLEGTMNGASVSRRIRGRGPDCGPCSAPSGPAASGVVIRRTSTGVLMFVA